MEQFVLILSLVSTYSLIVFVLGIVHEKARSRDDLSIPHFYEPLGPPSERE